MNAIQRPARVNVKLLVILVLVTGLVGVGAVVGHYVRKRVMAQNALAAGNAAIEAGDWVEATKQLKRYLSKYPDDQESLEVYAEAQLKVRPRELANIAAALGAYRRLLRQRPADPEICGILQQLYFGVRDYVETAHIARKRLEGAPDDAQAIMWLARSLAARGQDDEARPWLEKLIAMDPGNVKAYGLMSTLTMREDNVAAPQRALSWLDRAIASNPASAEARLLRSRFYRLVQKETDAAREDLQAAIPLACDDPGVILARVEESIALDVSDGLEADLAWLEQVGEVALERFGLDSDRFVLSRWMLFAQLARNKRDSDRCGAVADAAQKDLVGRHRTAFLPIAVELYVQAGRVDDAKRSLGQFAADLGRIAERTSRQEDQLALLRAIVAQADGRPYDVINLLEPLAIRDPDQTRFWQLLWRAYLDTDSNRRSLRALVQYVSRSPADMESILALAKGLKKQRSWPAVLALAKRADRVSPGNVDAAVLRLEATLRGAGGVVSDEARRETVEKLRALRAEHPSRADVRVLQALLVRETGGDQEMIVELQSALAECDDALTPGLYLANYYRRTQQPELAIETYRRIVERLPSESAPRLALAEFHRSAGNTSAARSTLAQGLMELTGQERYEVQLAMAKLEFSLGEETEGVDRLRSVSELHPSYVRVKMALLATGKIQSAPEVAQRLIDELREIEGETGLHWRVEQAMQWLRTGEWKQRQEEVAAMLGQCIRVDPDWGKPVAVLATVYRQLGNVSQAESLCRGYLEQHPRNMAITNILLQLLEGENRFSEAQQILERLPEQLRDSPLARTHQVGVAMGLGDSDAAEAELESLIEKEPNDVVARVLLAQWVYSNRKDVPRAMKLLDEAEAMAPSLTAIASTRISMLVAEGDHAEALSLANAMVERRKDYAAYRLRGGVHEAMGQADLSEGDYLRLPELSKEVSEGYSVLARYYHKGGRLQDALAMWDAGLAKDPNNLAFRRQMVASLINQDDPTARDRGRAVLAELLAVLPDDTGLLTAQAELLLQDGTVASLAQAEATLSQIVERDPRNVAVHLNLARLSYQRGDVNEALERLSRGLGSRPDDANLLLYRAELEASINNLTVARELAMAALERAPDNLQALNLLTDFAIREGAYQHARSFNQKVLASDSRNIDAQIWRARLLAKGGDRSGAVASLESFVEGLGDQSNEEVILVLASLYLASGELTKAGTKLDEAEAISPGNAKVFHERLRWIAAQDRHDEIASLVAARRTGDRSDMVAMLSAGWVLVSSPKERHWREARALFDEVVAWSPQQVEAQRGVAQAAYRLGDNDAVANAYRQILVVDPYHRQALNDLAWILSNEKGEIDEALQLADKGVNRFPNDPHLLDTRAVILAGLGRNAEARADLEACLVLAENIPPTKARVLLHLGRLLKEVGEADLAKQRLREALAIDEGIGIFSADERAEVDELLRSENH